MHPSIFEETWPSEEKYEELARAFLNKFTPDLAGVWKVRASWGGDLDHKGATSSEVLFKVVALAPRRLEKWEALKRLRNKRRNVAEDYGSTFENL
jgi:hypothetical protein